MNSVNLIGNICKDLELKSTNSGKSVCSFNLAVKRPFTRDVTDFLTVVCWNKQAENLVKFCGKGSRIGISGVLTTRTYEDSDGNKRTVYEVVANEVEFCGGKSEGQNNAPVSAFTPSINSDVPDGFMVVEDDDLPF